MVYSLDNKIYKIDNEFAAPQYLAEGRYPTWLDSKTIIGYHSPDNYIYYIMDVEQNEILKTYNIRGYGTFTMGRFSEELNKFIFQVNLNGHPSLAIMDIMGNIEITTKLHSMNNPVCSGVDDWLYYLNNIDGTRDVSRMKKDGSLDEMITSSQDYLYSNFSVSYDGNYIAVPKWNDSFHSISIIDTRTMQERLIDLTDLNLVGYTSFSKDNKYIYLTGGDDRDIYRINFDGTNLIQITDSAFNYYYRPLSW